MISWTVCAIFIIHRIVLNLVVLCCDFLLLLFFVCVQYGVELCRKNTVKDAANKIIILA